MSRDNQDPAEILRGVISTVGTDSLSCIDGTVAPEEYVYRVRAANFVDYSPYSNEASVTVPAQGVKVQEIISPVGLIVMMGVSLLGTLAGWWLADRKRSGLE